MKRAFRALSGVGSIWRNLELRRAQLGWGAAITAEWMHFVALGIFAYEVGGPTGSNGRSRSPQSHLNH